MIYVVEAGRNAYPYVMGSDFEVITHPDFSDRGASVCVLPIYHPRGGDPTIADVLSSYLSNGSVLHVLTERPLGSPLDISEDYPVHLTRLIEACEGHGVIGCSILRTLQDLYPNRVIILS